jgi:hypothetical protein
VLSSETQLGHRGYEDNDGAVIVECSASAWRRTWMLWAQVWWIE